MSHLAGIPNQAPTLDEWRAQVEATGRNYTDEATGSNTGHKRAQDAELSAIVSEQLGFVPDARAERLPVAPLRRKRGPKVGPESPDCRAEAVLPGGNHPEGMRVPQEPSEGATAPGMETSA